MSSSNTDPFQENVDSLRRVLTMPTTSVATPSTSPSPTVVASPMVNPTAYSGSAEACNEFFLRCSLALEIQPHQFTNVPTKFFLIMSLLTGRVLQWVEMIWPQNGPVTQSLDAFVIAPLMIMLYVNVHEHSLLTTYCQGLKLKLRLHLSAYDDVIRLEKFIQLSVRVTHLVQGCMEQQ